MEIFEYTKLTLARYKVDDDGKRFDVFWLNPVAMESLDSCNMPVFWFKSKVVGRLRKKLVLMPLSSLSW